MAALLLLAGICADAAARADDGPNPIDRYKRTVWTFENGAPIGVVDFAQSDEGYLWMAAPAGLYRFDGIQFEHIAPQQGAHAPSEAVTALLTDRSGQIWVGHYWGGVSIYKDGKLADANPARPNGVVRRIVEDRDGAIWVASDGIRRAGLRRYLHGKWDIVDASWGLPFQHLSDILVTRDGTLWVALSDGMLRLARGARHFTLVPEKYELGTTLAEAPGGTVWILNGDGVKPFAAGSAAGGKRREAAVDRNQFRMLFDAKGQMWLGGGSFRGTAITRPIPASVGEVNSQIDPRVNGRMNSVYGFKEDREGNIWVGTATAIERYHAADVITYITLSGNGIVDSSLDDVTNSAGIVFAHTQSSAQLFEIDRNRPPRKAHLLPADISTICADNHGGVWAVLGDGNFEHILPDHKGVVRAPPIGEGNLSGKCSVDSRDRLWNSAVGTGLFTYDQGRWSRVDVSAEIKGVWPITLATDRGGSVWAYYGTRDLVRIKDGRVTTVWRRGDISIGLIEVIYPTKGFVWLAGDTGLALYDGRTVKTLSATRFPFLSHISGFTETGDGTVWLVAEPGIVSIAKADLMAALDHPERTLKPRIFDSADGLPGASEYGSASNQAITGGDGRLWFAVADGIVSIDPAHLVHNPVAPPVLIRGLATDGKTYPSSGVVTLAAGTSNLRIDYTATSLSIPERVQFRYRLQGVDPDWVDPGRRRQAFYTNLGPGTYAFRVIASNNDGVWNRTGATMTFTIPPTFVQSDVFKALVVLAFAAIFAFLYRLRLRSLERTLRIRNEERLTERERIARELHDTLLQGFQALVLRFQNILDRIPASEPAHDLIEQELERADAVLAEGRNRVRDIRGAAGASSLKDVFVAAAGSTGAPSPAAFEFAESGTPRDLHPVVRDEIARIGFEAICNAARHAFASNIAVRLSYGKRLIVLRVSDDGIGIEPRLLEESGSAGHYGLVGMCERARRIQAKFKISSVKDGGTTVELAVPSAVAYVKAPGRRSLFAWLGRPAFGD
ncbi:MAG TPA: two-component regulator propeller domain-containing protein [Rhizomicrobium sp.]